VVIKEFKSENVSSILFSIEILNTQQTALLPTKNVLIYPLAKEVKLR
jgi:hypothetical protein